MQSNRQSFVIMKSLKFVTLLLQFSLLTKSVCSRSSAVSSIVESTLSLLYTPKKLQPATTISGNDLHRKRIIMRKMLIEPSSEELASTKVIMTASAEQNLQAAEVKITSVSDNAQYELSPQQFVYVVLTR